MRFFKNTITVAMVVALMGAVLVIPSSAAADTATAGEVNCYEHADHIPVEKPGSFIVKERSFTVDFRAVGLVKPIQEIAEPDVANAVYRFCQAHFRATIEVTRDGKRLLKRTVSADSDLETGRLDVQLHIKRSMKLVGDNKFCIRIKGTSTDPDQVITPFNKQKCGRTTVETKIVRIL